MVLNNPTAMPNAIGYLWNQSTFLTMNCRGYASSQFMQPEPATYACAPTLEQTTFFQPEKPYHSQHPGRFFYVLDKSTGNLCSAPYAPVNASPNKFEFVVSDKLIEWQIRYGALELSVNLTLDDEDPIEFWRFSVRNRGDQPVSLSVFPYFPFGYRSWMNQSAAFNSEINAIVSSVITPYQKSSDYWVQKEFKELSFLKASESPLLWEARQTKFEGFGGLTNPDGIFHGLECGKADYEIGAGVMQFDCELDSQSQKSWNFAFGAAQTVEQIALIEFDKQCTSAMDRKTSQGSFQPEIQTPDNEFDHFVNHWLVRQLKYHGELQRLTSDPQTRNFLQDAMGLSYLHPKSAKERFLHALTQQHENGSMPDGILLYEGASLKYINQVPHTDHAVWLPICLSAYSKATGDYDILNTKVHRSETSSEQTVKQCVDDAFDYLLAQTNQHGLSLIGEGDWCDPMNMVGIEGKGVSTWLTQAVAYAAKEWSEVCELTEHHACAKKYAAINTQVNLIINEHFWKNDRYCRGITDHGRTFGIEDDEEGALFLNPQSWAILCGAADTDRANSLMRLVRNQLMQKEGPTLLSPPFTKMVEDIGRVTQKFPGTAENGSVYNHAAAFYVSACFALLQADEGFDALKRMIPSTDEKLLNRHGQLPVFIPNYYRGAEALNHQTAGRSSQLIHTGSIAWFMRNLVEQLFGVIATPEGIKVTPKLPSNWPEAALSLMVKSYYIDLRVEHSDNTDQISILLNGDTLKSDFIAYDYLQKQNKIVVMLSSIKQ